MKKLVVLIALLLSLRVTAAEARKSVIDGIWIGPNVTLFGLITPLRFGLEVRVGESWMFSYDYGTFPRFYLRLLNSRTSEIPDDFSIRTHFIGARWRPWKGAFHIGLLAGIWTVTAPTVAPPASALATAYLTSSDISQYFLAPTIGWRFGLFEGAFLGIDLGWQIPIGSSGTYTIYTGPAGSADADQLKDMMDKLQKTSLPLITLLKLGYNF